MISTDDHLCEAIEKNDRSECCDPPFVALNRSPRYLRRASAARYIRECWGLPCEPSWLAKLAVTGGGPIFRKAGRFPVYEVCSLDSWADGRLSGPMRSTSDNDSVQTRSRSAVGTSHKLDPANDTRPSPHGGEPPPTK